ncbi:histone deacetylase 8-like isoform X2 [Tubulanus polymorphus]|uniref:histone deacetylase 8-like isoform X2 n=1 Tax=Tubulanus polymorphus TaxID=672921 RepID=UPI003DA20B47
MANQGENLSIDSLSSHEFTESNTTGLKAAYIYSPDYLNLTDQFIKVPYRASLVHTLLEAYKLLDKMDVIAPKAASDEELSCFHTKDYIDIVKKLSADGDLEKCAETADEYGLCYDCPAYEGVYEYAAMVAGASQLGAKLLNEKKYQVVMNWFGGWHHAKKDEAAGYCYFNDIVLGILELREKHDRVLYIDLDLHHGDGVEDAFCGTSKVMTISLHKFSPGFFPGTGSLTDVGFGKGRFYSLNVPLLDGIDDEQYFQIFKRLICKVIEQFNPGAVVCQCGADGVAGDPMASFNLTPIGLGRCVKYLLQKRLPLLLLGGGGYNLPNTARTWTYLTSLILDVDLDSEIPEHRYFTEYGPDYSLPVEKGYRTDRNSEEYIAKLMTKLLDYLDEVR